MVKLPRIMIAAASSGSGKTTIATGLMGALRKSGYVVSGHKVGPDYIDPGFHSVATGRPGRNLDPWLCSPELITPLLLHGSQAADLAIIEGVMGLFDGQLGTSGFASSAHIAHLTDTPVILAADASHTSRSLAAVVHGMATFDPHIKVAGVILNKVSSIRQESEIRDALEQLKIPVLGSVAKNKDIAHPERHLGLVPAGEAQNSWDLVQSWADLMAKSLDLDAIVQVAHTACDLPAQKWDPHQVVQVPDQLPKRPVVAVAGGRAFTFQYAETVELMEAAGLEVKVFDPLQDDQLPAGTCGIYIGGGFPEIHARELANNSNLNIDILHAIQSGVPTVAECAGLLYLGSTLEDKQMVGALPHQGAMNARLKMGYRDATASCDTLLTQSGESVHGHEFHRTRISGFDYVHNLSAKGLNPTWTWQDANGELVYDGISADVSGLGYPNVHASYLHLSWAGYPRLAQRFANACYRFAKNHKPIDLDHHGDQDVLPDGLDFAVNVHPDGPPQFMRQALEGADVTCYPNYLPIQHKLANYYGLDATQVLPTAGAAESFTLLARLWADKKWCMVHPQFTEPESALLSAGASVYRHVLAAPFVLDVEALLAAAGRQQCEVIMIGNPTNPTGVLHGLSDLQKIVDAGFLLVVDEAFLDGSPDNSALNLLKSQSCQSHSAPQVVVTKSLTKLWGIPGIRAGWLCGPPAVVTKLQAIQPPWSVSAHALAAIESTLCPEAELEAQNRCAAMQNMRQDLQNRLVRLGFNVVPHPAASFVLVQNLLGSFDLDGLRAAGISVRRCDTFPGLGSDWIRLAVRDEAKHELLCQTLASLLQRKVHG